MPLSPQAEQEALSLLVELIRTDTSNPPGGERPAAELLQKALAQDGVESQLVEKAPGRTNLVARLKGDGSGGGPLLLTGHLDVVPAEPQGWRHPPFAAEIEDGWLYGRGAVDMKNHVAACATLMRQLAREKVKLKRDVIFAAVADEEAGSGLGAQFLVDEHPELVRAEWALGELGGFTLEVGKKRLYPIQIATRGAVWVKLVARGPSGHGSMPRPDNAVLRLSRALMRIGNMALPVHPTEPTRRTLAAFGAARGFPASAALKLLTAPAFTDWALESLVADPAVRRVFNAILRNTASPTVLKAGGATNVIPEVAEAHVDGRILPGQTSAQFVRELRAVIEDDGIEVEILREIAPVEMPMDTPLYRLLEQTVKHMDPAGIAIPYTVPGFTDASAFAKLGTKFYGFAPIVFPPSPGVAFAELYHGRDERIPVAGFQRGVGALWGAVNAFCA
jgi:acetylornithine deacetylase/succinyl-diaminopimelate desuccinylase-like protein